MAGISMFVLEDLLRFHFLDQGEEAAPEAGADPNVNQRRYADVLEAVRLYSVPRFAFFSNAFFCCVKFIGVVTCLPTDESPKEEAITMIAQRMLQQIARKNRLVGCPKTAENVFGFGSVQRVNQWAKDTFSKLVKQYNTEMQMNKLPRRENEEGIQFIKDHRLSQFSGDRPQAIPQELQRPGDISYVVLNILYPHH